MKILATGDWQLQDNPTLDKLDSRGRSIRFQEHEELIAGVLDTGIKEGCELMVHLGDLTEHSNPRSTESEAAGRLFSRWLAPNIRKVIAAVGNHDGKIFEVSSSSFAPLAVMSGGQLLAPHHAYAYPLSLEPVELVVLPYLHGKTLEEIRDIHGALLKTLRPNTKKYLFMHYGVTAAVVGPRNLVVAGDKLDASALFPDAYEAIVAGHIHKQQVLEIRGEKKRTSVFFPGSLGYCDFGERLDSKGYIILDTKTGKVDLRQVEPKRRWVQATWPIDWPPLGDAPWREQDIVKIEGQYPRGLNAREELERLHSEGLPRPFDLAWAVVPEREQRVDRGADVVGAGSLLESAFALGRQKFAGNPLLDDALKLVAETLRDGRRAPLGKHISLDSLEAKDFTTFTSLSITARRPEPTLIGGGNGRGKTNSIEAILLLLSGKTSKGLALGDVVRQGESSMWLRGTLSAETGAMMTIKRTISRNKNTGQGTQKLVVDVVPVDGEPYRLDGTIAEVQRQLDEMLGAGYLSLKTCNFMFQKDPTPFVKTEAAERKKILAEVLCLEPVMRAHKVLNEGRKERQQEFHAAEQAIKAVAALKPDKGRPELESDLQEAQQQLQDVSKAAHGAQEAFLGAQRVESLAWERTKAAQGALTALPDPGRELAAQQQALTTRVETYTTAREAKKVRWQKMKDELDALDLRTPPDLVVLRARHDALDVKIKEIKKSLEDARALVVTASSAWGVEAVELRRLGELVLAIQGSKEGVCSKCWQAVTAEHLRQELLETQEAVEKQKPKVSAAQADVEVRKNVVTEASNALDGAMMEQSQVAATIQAEEREKLKRDNLVNQKIALEAEVKSDKESHEKSVATAEAKVRELGALVAEAEKKKAAAQAELAEAQKALDAAVEARIQAGHQKDEKTAAVAPRGYAVDTVEKLLQDLDKWEEVSRREGEAVERARQQSEIADIACAILDPKGGLPVYLVDNCLPFLEDRINSYMNALGMPQLRISLVTVEDDKETLAIVVDNGFEPRLDIRAFSGGQLDRVEVAVKMAMADLAAATRGSVLGILCYDEPTSGLDDAGKTALAEILFEKAAQDYPMTFVISHDEGLSERFSQKAMVSETATGASAFVEL